MQPTFNIKTIIQTTFHQRALDLMIFVTRVSIVCFMFEHGLPKFKKLLAGNVAFPDPLGFGSTASLALAVFAEVVCSVFILIGFGTRIAVIPLMINMLVAIFTIHLFDGFEKQELAWHYFLVYTLLFVTGSGKYSVDHWLTKNSHKKS